jgi:hypothetical protein
MGFLISWAQSRGGGRSPTTAPVVWKPVRVQPPVEDDDLALRREIIEDEKRASEDAMRALEEKLSKCEREIMAVRDIELEDWEGESPEERLRLREMIRREMIGKIRSEMRHLEWFRRRELDRAQAIREKLEKNDAEKAKKQP